MPKLHYWAENNGDGSVSVRFAASKRGAEAGEAKSLEETGEGWGEPSVGDVELRVRDGMIEFKDMQWDDDNAKWVSHWTPLGGR